MKKARPIYWLFIICYLIQFQFSGDWMLLGENTIYFALMPLIGVVIIVFRKELTESIPGKIMISLLVLSGCIATLKSVHMIESETSAWGIWLYGTALTLLIWEVMGFWSKVDEELNKITGLSLIHI